MKYLNKSFSVGSEKAYRDNYDRVFGKSRSRRAFDKIMESYPREEPSQPTWQPEPCDPRD